MRSPGLAILLLALVSISWMLTSPMAFRLARPDQVIKLPAELLEISALTDVDEHTVVCLHDEAAKLYFIDLPTGRVVRELDFGAPGDMEGLTRVGETYFALRSDGLMYKMRIGDKAMVVSDTFRLELPNRNIEGLGYDERMNKVLISPKDFMKGRPEVRDERFVYCLDPVSLKLCDEPVLRLSVAKIIAQANALGIATPTKKTENGRVVSALKLRFSSVAVEPASDLFYLLSAADKTLLVVDRNGELKHLEQLDEKMFAKPEGITFLSNGDMLISNEGKGSPPNILRFKRQF